ncbi:MAG: rhombosortase [Cellvibrionaceae bacterium]|nr:rhombosortase [Cellvibrionaceae bacterium]
MHQQHRSKRKHLQWHVDWLFVSFIGLLLSLAPVTAIIHALEVRPNLPATTLFMEPWRLLCGHFVHANWHHLGLNVINLIVVRAVFWEWLPPARFLRLIGFSALFISLGLGWTSNLGSYVGFSGVFYGLLVYLLLTHWSSSKRLFSLGLALVIVKLAYEQSLGANSSLAVLIGRTIATEAHLLGAASGLSLWLYDTLHDTLRTKQAPNTR